MGMSLENLQPYAGQHAIQSAVFALHFSAELDVGELSALRETAKELKTDFPNFADQHRVSVEINQPVKGESPTSSTTQDFGGFILEKPAPSVPVGAASLRSIIVSADQVIVVINDYTRWEKFRSDVEKYLSVLLKDMSAHKAIQSIGLQIADVFIWKADPADLKLSDVLSKTSPYLPANVFAQDALLWHSHHGFLRDQEQPIKHQQLDNVNVSRNVVSGAHQIQILTSHKATFNQPQYKFLDTNRELVWATVDQLHAKNKEMLAELLTQELQEKIALNITKTN
jgi:uncharacterized protein (TIGR04255 family)